jgi:hypothetical protein
MTGKRVARTQYVPSTRDIPLPPALEDTSLPLGTWVRVTNPIVPGFWKVVRIYASTSHGVPEIVVDVVGGRSVKHRLTRTFRRDRLRTQNRRHLPPFNPPLTTEGAQKLVRLAQALAADLPPTQEVNS